MNLSKLFELQRQLDEHVEREHPRQEGEDRLAKKILALLVELGELANCWRGFKYWSNDQEPRTKVSDFALWVKNGREVDEEGKPTNCFKNPLLEEYVDCLHFILSIGLEMYGEYLNVYKLELEGKNLHWYKHNNTTEQFVYIIGKLSDLYQDDADYEEVFLEILALGEMLGFTWEQIEQSYLQKNRINHERQNNGY